MSETKREKLKRALDEALKRPQNRHVLEELAKRGDADPSWLKRQAEKEAARQQDEEDLRSGKITREQLRERNSHFRDVAHEPLDWDKIEVV